MRVKSKVKRPTGKNKPKSKVSTPASLPVAKRPSPPATKRPLRRIMPVEIDPVTPYVPPAAVLEATDRTVEARSGQVIALTEARQFGKREAERARQLAAAQLRMILAKHDMAEFQAQTHAIDMVNMLAGLAQDVTIAPAALAVLEFRARMAMAVLDRAYGKVMVKAQIAVTDGGTPAADTKTLTTIESAKVAVETFQELSQYIGKVPYEQWPQHVKDSVEGGEAFAEMEILTGKISDAS